MGAVLFPQTRAWPSFPDSHIPGDWDTRLDKGFAGIRNTSWGFAVCPCKQTMRRGQGLKQAQTQPACRVGEETEVEVCSRESQEQCFPLKTPPVLGLDFQPRT